MARLLEIREKIRSFCGKYELYIKIVLRFILSSVAYMLINYNLGYMDKLNNVVLIVVLAIISAFLPVNVTVFISAVLVLVHLYSLHLEVCAVAAGLFLLILLLYYRFAPKYGYHAMLTPITYVLGISPLMPVSAGLLGSPSAIIAVAGGTVIYYFLAGVKAIAGLLSTGGSEVNVLELTLQLFGNREMFVVLVIYVVTALLVYLIRRSSINYAWLLAITAGTIFNLIAMLTVYVIMKISNGIILLIIGEAVNIAVALFIQFMVFSLDYTRVERVQFEDDEYYYYVKAVPKLYVPTGHKKIKQFHRADSEPDE